MDQAQIDAIKKRLSYSTPRTGSVIVDTAALIAEVERLREGLTTILKTIEGFIPLACCLTAVNEESFIAAAGIARKLLGEE